MIAAAAHAQSLLGGFIFLGCLVAFVGIPAYLMRNIGR